MSGLPTDLRKFYVYLHIDPRNNAVVYVGKGTAGRAWSCGTSTAEPGLRGNRSEGHQKWIDGLLHAGYTPDQWTRVEARGLTNEEALAAEKELITHNRGPALFNKTIGARPKLCTEQLAEAKRLRQDGRFYHQIAHVLGVSSMTVYRALNQK